MHADKAERGVRVQEPAFWRGGIIEEGSTAPPRRAKHTRLIERSSTWVCMVCGRPASQATASARRLWNTMRAQGPVSVAS